jgi:MoxR-like ATPase
MAQAETAAYRDDFERFERLQREGGIFLEREPDPEAKEPTGLLNVLGVELPTYATSAEAARILDGMVLSETDQDLLRTIAECYSLRQPLMLEGDPGSGKTFLVQQFTRLIHGAEAPVLRLAGTPRTSELDILGHWAPRGTVDDSKFRAALAELVDGPEDVTNRELAVAALEAVGQLQPDTEWEFKPGALLQAYTAREGRGHILMVDEFNLIPSNYQQIFLEISGPYGGMSEAVHFWGNGGQPEYRRGPDAWIVMASNFPEQTPGRNEVVAPMTDRLVWRTVSKADAQIKEEGVIRTLGGQIDQASAEVAELNPDKIPMPVTEPVAWREVEGQRLGYEVADAIKAFHTYFKEAYAAGQDEIAVQGDEHRTRRQQFEFSARNAMRTCAYIDRFQVLSPRTGLVDFPQTIRNAVERHYLQRLMSEERRTEMREALEVILTGTIGRKSADEEETEEPDEDNPLKEASTREFEGETLTRAEIMDRLTEQATMTPELKSRREEEAKRQAERQAEQHLRERAEQRTEMAGHLGPIIDDPNTPDSVREILESIEAEEQTPETEPVAGA